MVLPGEGHSLVQRAALLGCARDVAAEFIHPCRCSSLRSAIPPPRQTPCLWNRRWRVRLFTARIAAHLVQADGIILGLGGTGAHQNPRPPI